MNENIHAAVERYLALTPIEEVLPYKGEESGVVITHVGGLCSRCLNTLQGVRADLTAHPNCVEIRALGVCTHCMGMVNLRYRINADCSCMMPVADGTWRRIIPRRPSWWRKLVGTALKKAEKMLSFVRKL